MGRRDRSIMQGFALGDVDGIWEGEGPPVRPAGNALTPAMIAKPIVTGILDSRDFSLIWLLDRSKSCRKTC